MQLEYSTQERRFLAEVRAFLAPWRERVQHFLVYDDAALRDFYRALGERNWLALSWPVEAGGLGMPPRMEAILWDEMAHARIARPPLSAGVVAKTIIRFGSDAQKQRWLPPIRRGEIHFALGYSEPEAGSDLGAVRCRAGRDGDHYIVEGSKCWNSEAQHADYIWLLCRTGEAGSRTRGLSLLIVDRRAPGLRIRPIEIIDGNAFTELGFEGVRVPADCRIGEENGAWAMMGASLADERYVQFSPKRVRRDFEDMHAWCAREGLMEDAVVRERLAELAVDVLCAQAHGLAILEAMEKGRSTVVEAAANKLAYTRAAQNIARTAMACGAPSALLTAEPVEQLWRSAIIESIGGGTSEIMQGIVARQGLGLGKNT